MTYFKDLGYRRISKKGEPNERYKHKNTHIEILSTRKMIQFINGNEVIFSFYKKREERLWKLFSEQIIDPNIPLDEAINNIYNIIDNIVIMRREITNEH